MIANHSSDDLERIKEQCLIRLNRCKKAIKAGDGKTLEEELKWLRVYAEMMQDIIPQIEEQEENRKDRISRNQGGRKKESGAIQNQFQFPDHPTLTPWGQSEKKKSDSGPKQDGEDTLAFLKRKGLHL